MIFFADNLKYHDHFLNQFSVEKQLPIQVKNDKGSCYAVIKS